MAIREEELKNRIGERFFGAFDYKSILGNIDFCVSKELMGEPYYFLWAEAKRDTTDLSEALTQLILTIGKARIHHMTTPKFLGAFNARSILLVPYGECLALPNTERINWKAVTPSKHETDVFKEMLELVQPIVNEKSVVFDYETDGSALAAYIHNNFAIGTGASFVQIDKNNFVNIYLKWLDKVKPTIKCDWGKAQHKLLDADFYLADILSEGNQSITDKLNVILQSDHYEANRRMELGGETITSIRFTDGRKAHTTFWNRYKRPPKSEFWDYIIDRRDLLVPQDIRERRGSYYTPRQWVELSQKTLADVLGEDWQDEYVIWDCCAGTGNLLAGLSNKYQIWASTIEKSDVDIMKHRAANGANLLESHIFQFDFLNDEFSRLPDGLRDIVNDPDKRKKLVMYINPPYAEADNRRGEGRSGVAYSMIHHTYNDHMGYAKRELYIQFLARIYGELKRMFIVPASSFDNVKGQFPIGFHVWDTTVETAFEGFSADVYNTDGVLEKTKYIHSYDGCTFINDWAETFRKTLSAFSIAQIVAIANDFQNQRLIRIEKAFKEVRASNHHWQIDSSNLLQTCVYFAVRQVIPHYWLNDRDQFLAPDSTWETDTGFQNDCLCYAIFNNFISCEEGINHWIPFTEAEVGAGDTFKSHFMTDFIAGRYKPKNETSLLRPSISLIPSEPLVFSSGAKDVFDAGRALWAYYHSMPEVNVNASYYDIRRLFQGVSNGRMNSASDDAKYSELNNSLRTALKALARQIAPKIYEHGFLK